MTVKQRSSLTVWAVRRGLVPRALHPLLYKFNHRRDRLGRYRIMYRFSHVDCALAARRDGHYTVHSILSRDLLTMPQWDVPAVMTGFQLLYSTRLSVDDRNCLMERLLSEHANRNMTGMSGPQRVRSYARRNALDYVVAQAFHTRDQLPAELSSQLIMHVALA